jgi:hypothetical protein
MIALALELKGLFSPFIFDSFESELISPKYATVPFSPFRVLFYLLPLSWFSRFRQRWGCRIQHLSQLWLALLQWSHRSEFGPPLCRAETRKVGFAKLGFNCGFDCCLWNALFSVGFGAWGFIKMCLVSSWSMISMTSSKLGMSIESKIWDLAIVSL